MATISQSGVATRLQPGLVYFTATVTLPSGCGIQTVSTNSIDEYANANYITGGSALGNGFIQGVSCYYNGQLLWNELKEHYFEYESLDEKTIIANPYNDFGSIPPYNAKGATIGVMVNSGGSPSSISFRVRAHKGCSISDWKYFTIPLNPVLFSYSVNPNPATAGANTIQIEANTVAKNSISTEAITSINISDYMGNPVKQFKNLKGNKSLDIQGLKPGIYILEFIISDKQSEKQLLIITK